MLYIISLLLPERDMCVIILVNYFSSLNTIIIRNYSPNIGQWSFHGYSSYQWSQTHPMNKIWLIYFEFNDLQLNLKIPKNQIIIIRHSESDSKHFFNKMNKQRITLDWPPLIASPCMQYIPFKKNISNYSKKHFTSNLVKSYFTLLRMLNFIE